MYYRKFLAWAVAVLIALSSLGVASAKASVSKENEQRSLQGIEPLNLAVLIQDDLVSQVGNEIGVTKRFHSLFAAGIARDGWLHHDRYTASQTTIYH